MPKINVYLPDELAESVKRAGLPVSAICQRALERAVSSMREVDEAGPSWPLSRFTPRARQSLDNAHQQSTQRGHSYIGTEHLLLGILDEGGNVGCKALAALDVNADQARAAVEEVIAPQGKGGRDTPAYTPRAEQAVSHALLQALQMGHNYIGCEHLLLGLLEEQEGLASRALRRLGVDVRGARQVIIEILSGMALPVIQEPAAPPAAAKPADDVATTLAEILRRLEAIEERLAG